MFYHYLENYIIWRSIAWLLCFILFFAFIYIFHLKKKLGAVLQFSRIRQIFLDKIIDNIPLAIFAKEVKNEYRWAVWNKKAEELFQLTADEMLGKTDYDKFPEEEADFFRKTDSHVMYSGEVVDVPAENVTTARGTWIAHTIKVPIYDKDGNPDILLGILDDITQAKEREEQLKEYSEQLELQHRALFEAKREADRANITKSDFLANMSHEIRTPMNGVLGMTNLLLETELNEEQKGWAQIIKQSADNLMRIINDILDFSKIEAGKLELDPIEFDLHQSVIQITDILSIIAQEKGVELLVDFKENVPQNIKADQIRFNQVLLNLIGNALKFTQKGHVYISVSSYQRNDKEVRFQIDIEDTGVGIDDEKLYTIFDKFTQAEESTTRRFGGTGLGLTISAHIAELMGGGIYAASTPGKGSTFSFQFLAELLSVALTDPNADNLNGKRILIVDKSSKSREILLSKVLSWGMIANHTPSLKAAEKMLFNTEVPYDYILIDTHASLEQSVNFFKIMSFEKQQSIFILINQLGQIVSNQELEDAKIDIYFTKPYIPDKLKKAFVYAALHKHEAYRLITRQFICELVQNDIQNLENSKKTVENKKVLVVEDMKVNTMLIVNMLKKYGLNVEVAENGKIALDKVAKTHYDLILMDCQMPVMDGFEATAAIRQLEKDGKKMSVIVALTADAMTGDREKCLDAGMDDYLNKPLMREELERVIFQWL